MESKFIRISQDNEVFENKPVYRVYSKKDDSQLAIISWYKPWRKYVFSTNLGIVFDLKCLTSITEFLEELN